MSLLIPCSSCASRLPGKLANVTVAWYTADQERVAYRLRLCMACYATQIAPLTPDPDLQVCMCPVCHTESESDLDPVYITSFLPGFGKVQLELATDAVCAVKVRGPAQERGQKLENQFGGLDPGPQTGTPVGAADWSKLGLYPRE